MNEVNPNEELKKLQTESFLLEDRIYKNQMKLLESEMMEIKMEKEKLETFTKEYGILLIKEQDLLKSQELLINEYTNFLQNYIDKN